VGRPAILAIAFDFTVFCRKTPQTQGIPTGPLCSCATIEEFDTRSMQRDIIPGYAF
jgi:hypothetical protein